MPIINRISDFHEELTAWRRDLHAHPEIAFEEHRTSAIVAERLKEMGIEVHQGLAGTGVVGTLRSGSGPAIGLRADMDALPMAETGDRPHRSTNENKMHACGHDGHTTMLLGAAKYLAETKNFDGTVHFIFQPAEEGHGGGQVMVQDGLFDLFPAEEVYGMHNMPGMAVGEFAVRPGPMMAGRDNFEIRIRGKGSHAAMPHWGVDPVIVGANVVMAMQTITSRNIDPQQALVVSITQFQAGDTFNVIPHEITLKGTCRVFDPELRETLPGRITHIIEGIAGTYGATAELEYFHGYPATVNTVEQSAFCAEVAEEVAGGADKVNLNPVPSMGAEDFSYMLLERPGCYIWTGNGESAGLHHPEYDFNDQALLRGASYWSRLVERRLAKSA